MVRDSDEQKLRLQREDYWMKKLRTIYSYRLNERVKNSNLEQPAGKISLPFPRFGNRLEILEKRRVHEPTKFDTTETILTHITTFAQKNRIDSFRKILEGMRGKDLRNLPSNPTDD